MSPVAHRLYIAMFVVAGLFTLAFLIYNGASYYDTSMEERFYHPDHDALKPSGTIGHGLGIVGTFLILFGVGSYMTRKRLKSLRKVGVLKYWLEFHIFLCSVGPVMVLFHTAFKFGGIVSISFWSMVAVVLSGVIGRFIYIQIPRTIEGRELSLNEVRQMRTELTGLLKDTRGLDERALELIGMTEGAKAGTSKNILVGVIQSAFNRRQNLRKLRSVVKPAVTSRKDYRRIMRLAKDEMALGSRIQRLQTMQKLFRYWHVAHLPFAIIMLLIMVVHVVVTITFGYRWIF